MSFFIKLITRSIKNHNLENRSVSGEEITEIKYETTYYGVMALVYVRRILGIDHKIRYEGHYVRTNIGAVQVKLHPIESQDIFDHVYHQFFMNN